MQALRILKDRNTSRFLLEKRALPELAKKKKAETARAKNMRGDFYGTKKQVKSLMKFK